jgi:steroid delta-isomerase-like uncharacterized protein
MTAAERNKTIIRRIFEEGLNQGNLAIIDELFDPRFVDHATPDQPPGPQGVKGYFAAVRAGFPDMRVTIDDLIAEDARVAVRTTWRGTHLGTYEGTPASSRPVARSMIQIFHIEGGKILEEWNEGADLLSSK